MSDLSNPSSQVNAGRTLRFLCIGACLLATITAGLVLAQQTLDAQSSAKPAATVAPSAQSDTKKAPDAPASPTPPAVTDPRQAQIIADTQKLVKLSEELKAEVAKSTKDTLSLTVIKKAEEVEKQAKTLKEELNKAH